MSSDPVDDALPTPRPSTQISSGERLSTATVGSLPRYSVLGNQIHGGLPFGSPYGPVQFEERDNQIPPRYSLVASDANGGALPHLEHIFTNHSDGTPWATLHIYSRASTPNAIQEKEFKPPVPVYYSGDTIVGVLALNLSAPQTIQQIVVSLRGKIVTPFLDGGSYVFFSYDKLIWDRIEGDPNRSTSLLAGPSPQTKKKKWDGKLHGNYRFPFAFPVPSYGDLVSATGVLPETMATPFSLSSTPTFSTPSSPSFSNNSRSGTPLHSHPVPTPTGSPSEKRAGFKMPREEHSNYMTPSSAFSSISPTSQSPSSTTSHSAYRVWEKPSVSGFLPSRTPESASDNSSALNYEPDGDSPLEPERTVNGGVPVNTDKPLPSLPPSSPTFLSSTETYQDDKTPTPNSTWETSNKPLLSPLPQSYIEKDAKITVQYDLSVQMAHGWMKGDTTVRTRITFLQSSVPPPMPLYRLRAYRDAEALDAGAVPSPLVDPMGWHTLPDVTFEGLFTGYDYEVKIKYSLSIARPLSYSRGTHVPLHLAISISSSAPQGSAISTTIKEGMTDPSTVSARLTRRLRYFYPTNGNGTVCASLLNPGPYAAMGAGGGFIAVGSSSTKTFTNSARTFEEEKIGLKEKGKGKRKGRMHSNILGVAGARWWKAKEDVFSGQAKDDVTFLRGEILLDKNLQSSSACPLFNLEYYVELMTPVHPRFEDLGTIHERTGPSLGHRTTPSNLAPRKSNMSHRPSPSMISLASSASSTELHGLLKKSPSMTTMEERRQSQVLLRTLASHPVEITTLCRQEEMNTFRSMGFSLKDHSHEDFSSSRRGNWWEGC